MKTLTDVISEMDLKYKELAAIQKDQIRLLEKEGVIRTELQHLENQKHRLMNLQGGFHEKSADRRDTAVG